MIGLKIKVMLNDDLLVLGYQFDDEGKVCFGVTKAEQRVIGEFTKKTRSKGRVLINIITWCG